VRRWQEILVERNVERRCDGLNEEDALLEHNLEACRTAAVAGADMAMFV